MSGIRGLTGWLGVAISCPDPRALARFYRDLLGWEISSEAPDWVTMVICDPAGHGTSSNLAFALDEQYRPPVWPSSDDEQQMMAHLDVGVTDLAAAVEDALALGATLASYQPQEDVRVLLDPAGHPFCLYVDDGA